MIKIAIIDDNQFHIAEVEQKLGAAIRSRSGYTVSKFQSADSFLAVIDSEKFDIVFLDIVLGNASGIDIGKQINQKMPGANIIFVSSDAYYFKDVYQVSHSYFLIKPFEDPRFNDAVKKAVAGIKRSYITIDTRSGSCKIVLSDVMYFENTLRHTKVYMSDGSIAEYNTNLRNIETLLPESDFLRTHQSFIVNMNYIKKYDRQNVFMGTDISIPISRAHTNTVREKITCFLGGVI